MSRRRFWLLDEAGFLDRVGIDLYIQCLHRTPAEYDIVFTPAFYADPFRPRALQYGVDDAAAPSRASGNIRVDLNK